VRAALAGSESPLIRAPASAGNGRREPVHLSPFSPMTAGETDERALISVQSAAHAQTRSCTRGCEGRGDRDLALEPRRCGVARPTPDRRFRAGPSAADRGIREARSRRRSWPTPGAGASQRRATSRPRERGRTCARDPAVGACRTGTHTGAGRGGRCDCWGGSGLSAAPARANTCSGDRTSLSWG